MASSLLDNIPCSRFQVLNPWEQTLYNLCEEYFSIRQLEKNRLCVLGQVRVVDAISVGAVKNGKATSFIGNVQFTALSFDILVTDRKANPLFAFEADGEQHKREPQLSRDQLKDAIATKAGMKVFRMLVDGSMPPLEVIHAEASIEGFERDLEYPVSNGRICYSEQDFPDVERTLELADIELQLIRAGWPFPADWKFVTQYELR